MPSAAVALRNALLQMLPEQQETCLAAPSRRRLPLPRSPGELLTGSPPEGLLTGLPPALRPPRTLGRRAAASAFFECLCGPTGKCVKKECSTDEHVDAAACQEERTTSSWEGLELDEIDKNGHIVVRKISASSQNYKDGIRKGSELMKINGDEVNWRKDGKDALKKLGEGARATLAFRGPLPFPGIRGTCNSMDASKQAKDMPGPEGCRFYGGCGEKEVCCVKGKSQEYREGDWLFRCSKPEVCKSSGACKEELKQTPEEKAEEEAEAKAAEEAAAKKEKEEANGEPRFEKVKTKPPEKTKKAAYICSYKRVDVSQL